MGNLVWTNGETSKTSFDIKTEKMKENYEIIDRLFHRFHSKIADLNFHCNTNRVNWISVNQWFWRLGNARNRFLASDTPKNDVFFVLNSAYLNFPLIFTLIAQTGSLNQASLLVFTPPNWFMNRKTLLDISIAQFLSPPHEIARTRNQTLESFISDLVCRGCSRCCFYSYFYLNMGSSTKPMGCIG